MLLKGDSPDSCALSLGVGYKLSRFEELTLVGGLELERALGWLGRRLAEFTYHDKFGSVDAAELRKAAAFYDSSAWRQTPSKFFVAPTQAPSVVENRIHVLSDGAILDLSFQSSYSAQYPGFQAELEQYANNRTAHARWWRHSEPARGTVVAVHGWTMGDQRINSLAFQPGFFYKLGLDMLLIELPYHGRRTPSGRSEERPLFPSADFIRTNEALGQAVSDLRELGLYLKGQGVTNIGCLGMSLGAYVGSLWASLDELSFCIPVVPVVSMSELAWRVMRKTHPARDLRRNGISEELFERLYALHCPLNHSFKLPPSRAIIIAGLADKIVPTRQPKLLWRHWGHPQMFWIRGGHIARFKSTKAFSEVVNFLESLGLVSNSHALKKTSRD